MRSTNGTAYEWHGDESQPVLALIHGLGLNRRTWEGHVSALAKDYRVLSFDLYGHGESVASPRVPTLSLFSSQLLELLDELGVSTCCVVGFSLGGMINRRFAMDYPERVSSLVILNSPHDRGELAQKIVEQRALESYAGGPSANIDETLARWFTPTFRTSHPDTVQRVKEWVLGNDPLSYAQCREVLAQGVIELIRPEKTIDVPTLVLTCENDTGSTPAMSYQIANEGGNAVVKIIPELQHMGLMEQPKLFYQLILDFLSGLRS